LRHGIPLILGILLALILGLSWLGFPGFLTRWILATANEGDYFMTASRVKLDLRGGLDAFDVMVYRKGLTGPPLLETRQMQVLFHWLEMPHAGESRIKELRASRGIIRPLWGQGGSGRPAETNAAARGNLAGAVPAAVARRVMTVTLTDFDVLGVWVEEVKTQVQIDDGSFRLSGLSGRVGRDLQRGAIEGTLAWDSRQQARGHLVTSFDPHALVPVCALFYPKALPVLDLYSFPSTPPRLDLAFEADWRTSLTVRVEGKMTASQFAFRGAGIGFANVGGAYVYENGASHLKLDPFLIVVRGRKAWGKAEYDFGARTSSFEVISEIDMAAALRLAGVKEQAVESWQFEEGSRIVAKGVLDLQVPERSRVEATVEGSSVGYGLIQAHDYAFRYQRDGQTNLFTEVRGKVGGGSFSGTVSMEPGGDGSNRVSRVRAEIIHADADELIKILSGNRVWRTAGKLYGTVEWVMMSGASGKCPLAAEGQLTLRNATVLKLPLFDGLKANLARVAPGVDFSQTPVDSRVSFKLVKGRVESQDITIECGPVVLAAKGSCGLDGTLDFTVGVRAVKKKGGLGKALASLLPSGSLPDFKLEGTLDAPQWRRIASK
jgi:hypothetical protein